MYKITMLERIYYDDIVVKNIVEYRIDIFGRVYIDDTNQRLEYSIPIHERIFYDDIVSWILDDKINEIFEVHILKVSIQDCFP